MTTAPGDHNSTSIDRSFTLPFVHRVRFTGDVWGAEREVLADVLTPSGGCRVRAQFWIDENVSATNPWLEPAIREFCRERNDRLELAGPPQRLPGGEVVKDGLAAVEPMLERFHAEGLDRRSYVVAIGGGAVLDAVGFAASIAHRGLRLVRLPTSTLSQGDSGVGVKNGVNLFGTKNWLGAFAVPWAVINDERLLRSLSDRDWRCGFSEAVKVALLKDSSLLDLLCRKAAQLADRAMEPAREVLRRAALLHLDHIAAGGDPFERSAARPLDFGHWSAHRLEAMSGFRLRHGEAVAIGVAVDCVYSSLTCGLDRREAERVLGCFRDLRLPLAAPELEETERLFAGLEEFRQHLGGQLTLTMIAAPGRCSDVHEISAGAMREAIEIVLRAARSGPPGR